MVALPILFIYQQVSAQGNETANVNANESLDLEIIPFPSQANITILQASNGTNFDPLTGLPNILIIGEAINNDSITSSPNTLAYAGLFDINGNIIATSAAPLVGKFSLLPGETGTFDLRFSDSDIIGGTLNAVFYQVQVDNGTQFLGFIPPPLPPGFGAGALLDGGLGAEGAGGGFDGTGGTGGGSGGGSSGGGGSFAFNPTFNPSILQQQSLNASQQVNLPPTTNQSQNQSKVEVESPQQPIANMTMPAPVVDIPLNTAFTSEETGNGEEDSEVSTDEEEPEEEPEAEEEVIEEDQQDSEEN